MEQFKRPLDDSLPSRVPPRCVQAWPGKLRKATITARTIDQASVGVFASMRSCSHHSRTLSTCCGCRHEVHVRYEVQALFLEGVAEAMGRVYKEHGAEFATRTPVGAQPRGGSSHWRGSVALPRPPAATPWILGSERENPSPGKTKASGQDLKGPQPPAFQPPSPGGEEWLLSAAPKAGRVTFLLFRLWLWLRKQFCCQQP